MLTYQLQTRVIMIEDGGELSFPKRVALELRLAPATAFGAEDKPSGTLVKGREATIRIDANTGRWLCQSKPALDLLDVTLKSPSSKLNLAGNILKYEFDCSDAKELEGTLSAFKWLLPPLLNLQFSEPPHVLYVRGTIGDTKFRWEHKADEWQVHIRSITPEKLEEHVAFSFEHLSLFNGFQNRRLAAALSYFYVAVRLNVCGESPWEFMSETILNYAKCMESLFVTSEDSRADVRRELENLGYTNDEIEGDFIPILILRSYVDIAHAKAAIYKTRELKVLYRYMALAEERFREMLCRILSRVIDGTYKVPQRQDLSLDKKEQKILDRLITQMESRLGIVPS